MKKHYVPQVDARDCGVAALSMILKHHGTDLSLARLRELAKTTAEGTSALGLIEAAKKVNFETKAIQADETLFDMEELPYPFIAHVLKEGKLLHYYVVYKEIKDKILIADPDPTVKIIKMDKKRFLEEWSGVALFFAPEPAYKPEKEKWIVKFYTNVIETKNVNYTNRYSVLADYFVQYSRRVLPTGFNRYLHTKSDDNFITCHIHRSCHHLHSEATS